MRIVSSLLVIAAALLARRARAEQAALLVVERAAGAERCPDADAIGMRVEQIRGRKATAQQAPYRVTFRRKEEGFVATIRNDATESVRTLEHDGAHCTALGNAVAVTLVLLLDSDIEPKKKPEAPPPLPVPSVVAPPAVPSPAPSSSREATLSLGALALAGVLRPISPAFTAEAGAGFAPFRVSAGAIWGWPQTLSLGPGKVHERLVGGFARACFAPWQRGGLRFDACTGAAAAAVMGSAEGYTQNQSHTRAWSAVPIEVAFAGWTAPVGWELTVAGLVPIARPDFSIEGVGVGYRSPPIGAMLSLRIAGILLW